MRIGALEERKIAEHFLKSATRADADRTRWALRSADAWGVNVRAAWKPRLRLVLAASMGPTTSCTSAIAASSPDIITSGTPKCPARAAFHEPSVTFVPLSATLVRFALVKVCARTPAMLMVPA